MLVFGVCFLISAIVNKGLEDELGRLKKKMPTKCAYCGADIRALAGEGE
jgi:hypothetical protein